MKKILMLGLLLSIICITGTASAINIDAVRENYVTSEQASICANSALTMFLNSGSPGLMDVPGENNWEGAKITEDPLVLYDINGAKIFYQFTVEKNGIPVGQIKTSASKVLGAPVITIELLPRIADFESAEKRAIEIMAERYPDNEIDSILPVCYAYPKIGVMVKSHDKQSGAKNIVVVDAFDFRVVDNMGVIPGEESNEMISFYEKMPEDEAEQIKSWENRYYSLIDHTEDFSIGELLDDFPYSKVLTVTLYDQDNSYYCVPAVGQMIADYYGVTHSQSHIATQMNTTINGTLIGDSTFGELRYYINNPPDCLGKEDSFNETAASTTWTRVKEEINDDRPFNSRIIGHARVCKGYMVTDIDSNWILVNDPWPVGEGEIRWEMWDYVNHNIFNVYVI